MAKWILVLAVLVPLGPDVLYAVGSTSGMVGTAGFFWIVHLGIIAAVLCIVLFLLYTVFRRYRKQ